MTSKSIYPEFKPTYLYIKQHSVTGLLYFGKTVRAHKAMLRYTGSGHYWSRHYRKHGKEYIETIWYCLFYEQTSLIEFALQCSNAWNIVNAVDKNGNKIWANEKLENGLDGGNIGFKHSQETIAQMRINNSTNNPRAGVKLSSECKIQIGNSRRGKLHSDADKLAIRIGMIGKSNKGVPQPKTQCPHCHLIGGKCAMKQHHFDNCKLNPANIKL